MLFRTTPCDDQAIQFWKITSFDEEGSLDECRVASAVAGPIIELLLNGFFDAGMNDGVEASQLLLVSKDYGGELGAIDAAAKTENFGSELAQDVIISRLARLKKRVREGIGVENGEAHFAEHGGDGAFAAGDSAGQAHAEHASVSGHWQCAERRKFVGWSGEDARL